MDTNKCGEGGGNVCVMVDANERRGVSGFFGCFRAGGCGLAGGGMVMCGVGAARGKPASKVGMVHGGGVEGSMLQWRQERGMYVSLVPVKESEKEEGRHDMVRKCSPVQEVQYEPNWEYL